MGNNTPPKKSEVEIKRFPLKLSAEFSGVIDEAVFIHNRSIFNPKITKHDYIIKAIEEKLERDQENKKIKIEEGV